MLRLGGVYNFLYRTLIVLILTFSVLYAPGPGGGHLSLISLCLPCIEKAGDLLNLEVGSLILYVPGPGVCKRRFLVM